MTGPLTIEVGDWEFLAHGEPEERACFGALGIRRGDRWLTEAEDRLAHRLRPKPYLSAYALAEFLVWNWWRIRWEPRAHSVEWQMAHNLAAIGGGYIWPNLVFDSDGLRAALLSRSTDPRPAEPLRYVGAPLIVIDALELEQAFDQFLGVVLERLREEKVAATNLHAIWARFQLERTDSSHSEWRKLEAMLGSDPDEGSKRAIKGLIADGAQLGRDAMTEIAADHDAHRVAMTGRRLAEIARSAGIEANSGRTLQLLDRRRIGDADDPTYTRGIHRREVATGLSESGSPYVGTKGRPADFAAADAIPPAWQQGVSLAIAARQSAGLSTDVLDDHRLCDIAGLPRSAVDGMPAAGDVAFWLDDTERSALVVLRSRSPHSRRFEIARLVGDRLGAGKEERLFPATRTYTYRQKQQRAFAAELLCPTEALADFLGKAQTAEDIEDAAGRFRVPAHVITTQLLRSEGPSVIVRDDFDEAS